MHIYDTRNLVGLQSILPFRIIFFDPVDYIIKNNCSFPEQLLTYSQLRRLGYFRNPEFVKSKCQKPEHAMTSLRDREVRI